MYCFISLDYDVRKQSFGRKFSGETVEPAKAPKLSIYTEFHEFSRKQIKYFIETFKRFVIVFCLLQRLKICPSKASCGALRSRSVRHHIADRGVR